MTEENLDYFLQEKLKLDLELLKKAIESQAAGNYSKSYETYKRIQNCIKYFKEEIENKKDFIKIVDIGCSNGYYIFLLNSLFQLNNKALFFGIDISPLEINLAKSLKEAFKMDNVTFEIGHAFDLQLPDSSFDIVICFELIEHLAQPQNCLKEIRRILKDGGVAIITTPNKDNLFLKLSPLFNHSFKIKEIDSSDEKMQDSRYGFGHISIKGLSEWSMIIREQGLKIEGIKRGSLFCGGSKYNSHPIFFAIGMILDRIFDYFPFTLNFTENITFKLRKASSY